MNNDGFENLKFPEYDNTAGAWYVGSQDSAQFLNKKTLELDINITHIADFYFDCEADAALARQEYYAKFTMIGGNLKNLRKPLPEAGSRPLFDD